MSKQFLSEGETKSVYQKACEAFGGKSETLYEVNYLSQFQLTVH